MDMKVKYVQLSLAYFKVMFHWDQPFQMQLVTLFCYKGCHLKPALDLNKPDYQPNQSQRVDPNSMRPRSIIFCCDIIF